VAWKSGNSSARCARNMELKRTFTHDDTPILGHYECKPCGIGLSKALVDKEPVKGSLAVPISACGDLFPTVSQSFI
jgi:hypothetical protein